TASTMRHRPHQRVAVRSAPATSSNPAPYFSESAAASASPYAPGDRALAASSLSTAAGLVTPTDSSRAAAPATWGAAMLVPWNHRYTPFPAARSMVSRNPPARAPCDLSPPAAAMRTSGPYDEYGASTPLGPTELTASAPA